MSNSHLETNDIIALFVGPALAACLKSLHDKARPVEKVLQGIGNIISGVVLGGYLRLELHWNLWETTLVVIVATPILFSFIVVVSDNSAKLASDIFTIVREKIMTSVREFSFKKSKDTSDEHIPKL